MDAQQPSPFERAILAKLTHETNNGLQLHAQLLAMNDQMTAKDARIAELEKQIDAQSVKPVEAT